MKKWLKSAALAAMLTMTTTTAFAWAPGQMVIPEDIYTWIQSTDRMNYYINKKKIAYDFGQSGDMYFGAILVPVIKSYDGVQVKDIVEKRKWRDQSVEGFEFLSGEADYIRINFENNTVLLNRVDYLTYSMTTLESKTPNQLIELAKLPAKSVERRFYESIILYEQQHYEEIIKNTKEKLTEEEFNKLKKARNRFHKKLEKRAKG